VWYLDELAEHFQSTGYARKQKQVEMQHEHPKQAKSDLELLQGD
jgi:hypothetical protein